MHAPAPRTERFVTLDFVRGIAVMGILLLNIVGFAWPEIVYISPRAPGGPPVSASEDWTWLAIFVLADGKFRGLFSLLFGASLLLFVTRADDKAQEEGGRDGTTLQKRRLGWLAAFGLAHFFLIWWGDILFLYAVCGFAALALRDWPVRRLVRWALVIYAGGALAMGALTAFPAAAWLGLPEVPGAAAAEIEQTYQEEAQEERRVMLGPWPEQVAHTLRGNWYGPLTGVALIWFETLPLMLLGMALFKAGLFAGTWSNERLARWAWRGIAAGLVLTVPIAAWLWIEQFPLTLVMFAWLSPAMLARLPSIVGYAALLVLLARYVADSRLGERVVAAGRMAFSNYLGTSLLMTFLFHGWGLGLYAGYGRLELMAFVLLGWIVMLAWSKPWLGRFRYGPLEWAWRSLTYGRVEPLRRKPLAIATDSQ